MQLSGAAKKVFSGSALRVCNLLAAVVVSFLLIPFVVHSLGDRLYGFWSLAATFVGYYGLLDLGLSAAVTQYVCVAIGQNDDVECRKIFNTAFRIQSTLGAVVLLGTIVLAAASPWLGHDPAEASLFWKVILVLGVNMALVFPMKVYTGVLDATLRFDIQTMLDFLGLMLRTILTVVAIRAGWGVLGLAWITLLASLPVMALQFFYARREASWARLERATLDRKKMRSLFSYSVFTAISNMANTLRFSLDALVVTVFVGLAAVTHYKVAAVFSRYYIGIVIALMWPIQPVLSRLYGQGDRQKLQNLFSFATKISTCISVLICFGLIAWGKPFIIRWMGPAYTDAYLPLILLSLAVFLDVCQSPSIVLLNSTFHHRSYAYMNLAEGLINLVASLLLARPLGIVGVALGTLIGAFFIRVLVQPWQTSKASGIALGAYMKVLGGALARSAILIGASIVLAAWGLKPNYPYIVASAGFAAAVYLAASLWVVFSQAERKQLLSMFAKWLPKQWTEPGGVPVVDGEGTST